MLNIATIGDDTRLII